MKTFSNIFTILTIGILITMGFTQCVKQDFDEPEPYVYRVDLPVNMSIAELKQLYDGDTTLIPDSIIIRGTVVSSDKNGNFYKELVIQDSTGGISISIDRSDLYNDYPFGEFVYVKCGGLYLGEYGEVIQIGSLYEDNGIMQFGRMQGWEFIQQHLLRDDRGEAIIPDTIELSDFSQARINTLVAIKGIQFTNQNLGETFADGLNNIDKNRDIENCEGTTRILRTSGYASFASDTVPSGNGTIVAVLGSYNGDYQLKINGLDCIDFNGARCPEPLIEQTFAEGFNDWTTFSVIGDNQVWEISSSYGNPAPCAVMSGYDGQNFQNEDWLISPEFDGTAMTSIFMSFVTASNYSGSNLEVLISTDYNGTGNPNDATWTNITATLSNGSFAWVASGDIDITSYKNATMYVAFKYISSNSNGKTWEIDNIEIWDPTLFQ